jgi:hypothetical protein
MKDMHGLIRSRVSANVAEENFARSVEAEGKTWIFQPRQFRLPSGRSYRPDFLVVEDRCFYEVIATRQAYSFARTNIAEFRMAFPRLRLRVVNLGAWKSGPRGPRVETPKRPNGRRRLERILT